MRKFLLGSVGLAAMIAGPAAMAADLRPPPPPPPVAYYNWSGAYIGFNVGGIWHETNRTFPTDPFANISNHSTSDSDGILGFHAGAQWQWGAWVLGAEAALSGMFQRVPNAEWHPSGRSRLFAEYVQRAQDHQPFHRGWTAGLRMGSVDDLRDGWLGFSRS